MKRWCLCFAACIGVLIAAPAFARAQSVVDLRSQDGFANLAPYVEVYEDPAGTMTPDTIARATFVANEKIDLDHPSSTYWIRLRYQGSAETPWLLTAGYRPWQADLFVNGTLEQNGDAVPYALRPERHYNWIAFSLPPSASVQTAYLRIRTYEPLVNLVAYTRDEFRSMLTRDIVVIAALLGVLG